MMSQEQDVFKLIGLIFNDVCYSKVGLIPVDRSREVSSLTLKMFLTNEFKNY